MHLKVRLNFFYLKKNYFKFFVSASLHQPPSLQVQKSAIESIHFFYVAYYSKIFQKQGHLFTVLSDSLIKKKLFQAVRRGRLPKNGLQDKEKVLDSITDLEYTEVDIFIENRGVQPVIPVKVPNPRNSSRLARAERARRLESMRSTSSSFSNH